MDIKFLVNIGFLLPSFYPKAAPNTMFLLPSIKGELVYSPYTRLNPWTIVHSLQSYESSSLTSWHTLVHSTLLWSIIGKCMVCLWFQCTNTVCLWFQCTNTRNHASTFHLMLCVFSHFIAGWLLLKTNNFFPKEKKNTLKHHFCLKIIQNVGFKFITNP